jgi:hypothetical protein
MKRLESLWLLYISGLPWERYHPKPNVVSLFPPRPQTLETGSGFSCETPSGSLFFPFFFSIPALPIGSHMRENLKTSFHPEQEQLVLNVRTGRRTESPSENPAQV